jgi:hypothetical protein
MSMNESQIIAAIKAHIARGDKAADKAEQHYIAAGKHLKTLKAEHTGSWSEWEALLRERVGIGKSRASELMAIADGTKILAEVRAATAERNRRLRHDGEIPVDVAAYVAKDLGVSWEEAYPLITRDDDERTFHAFPGPKSFLSATKMVAGCCVALTAGTPILRHATAAVLICGPGP